MADMKEVNGVIMPCTAADEADIAAKESIALQKQTAYAKVQYLDQRAAAYPSIQSQLLQLWDSMDTGEIPKSAAFYNAILAINQQYPAPKA